MGSEPASAAEIGRRSVLLVGIAGIGGLAAGSDALAKVRQVDSESGVKKMGWRSTSVVANQVIIQGPAGELLVYSATAAPGNLIASIAAQPGSDQHGNSFLVGLTSYENVGGTIIAVNLNVGAVQFFSAASPAGPFTARGSIGSSGLASILTVFASLGLQEQAAPPATPTGSGILYTDNTGHLHYLGPGGTNTILANP